jgi:hypothetical protein
MAHPTPHAPRRLPARVLLATTLLVAVIDGAVALSSSAAELKLDAAQQEAVGKLRAKGAAVAQVAAEDAALSLNLALGAKSVGDTELALVGKLPNVVALDLRGTGVTDAGLAGIAGLTSLTRLNLERTGITDAGLAHLKGLTNLAYLNLYGTAVTDAGVAQLAGLKSLRRLYLWQTKVTDAGVAALRAANAELVIDRGEAMVAPNLVPSSGLGAGGTGTLARITMRVEPKDLRIDDEGYIRAWLVLAPIALDGESGAEEIDRQQVPNEKDLRPEPGEKTKTPGGPTLRWAPLKTDQYFFDLNAALGSVHGSVAAYAVVYLDAAEPKSGLRMLMSSNDQGKVYVNGKELVKSTIGRTLEKDQDVVDGVTLTTGTNVIVFKVINEGNNWQGALRFTTSDGKPVTDLTVKLSPTGKPLPDPKAAVAATNLLQPAGDPAHWAFEQHEQAKGTVASAEGGILFDVARITGGEGTDWHIQAYQNSVDLNEGTAYVLRFKAKADAERTMRASAALQEEDWHTVGLDDEVDLGTGWRDYTYTFTAKSTLPKKTRVGFVLGNATGKVYLKDLSLTEQ